MKNPKPLLPLTSWRSYTSCFILDSLLLEIEEINEMFGWGTRVRFSWWWCWCWVEDPSGVKGEDKPLQSFLSCKPDFDVKDEAEKREEKRRRMTEKEKSASLMKGMRRDYSWKSFTLLNSILNTKKERSVVEKKQETRICLIFLFSYSVCLEVKQPLPLRVLLSSWRRRKQRTEGRTEGRPDDFCDTTLLTTCLLKFLLFHSHIVQRCQTRRPRTTRS